MLRKYINSIFILGAMAILGIIVLQLYWLAMTWQIKTQEFHERVNVSLRRVAEQMAIKSDIELPKQGLIKQLSSNAYLVNYNEVIEPDILEDYLIREMDVINPDIKFEYAVYDCFTNDLVYGNCCGIDEGTKDKFINKLPDLEKYTYYFIVRFPDQRLFLLYNLKLFILLGLFAVIVVFSYLYAIRMLYKQKRLSELQKDFVDNMTHEFKTPLTSIKLAADVVGKSEEVNSNARLKKYAGIISQQSEKLTSHIERMLDLIRSDKKFNLKLEEIDLVDFVKQLLLGLDSELGYQNVNVDFNYPKKQVNILADKYHFNNILFNIIDNSIKYNDKTDKQLNISITENDTEYLLSIEDNGIGISKEHIRNIFKKFYRVQKGDVHDVKGFGLGLYYVKNIVNLHGWMVDATSKENQGTIFTINIKK